MTPHAFRVAVTTSTRRSLSDVGGLGVSVGFYVIVASVLGTLWRTAVHANGGPIAGYSAVAFTWYAATAEAATVSLNTRLIEEVGLEIATGSVAVELLRPVSMLAVRVASELGRTLPRLAVCAAAGIVVSWTAGGAPPSGYALALAAPSLVLAVAASLVAQHAFAAASFWIRDARATWFVYQKIVFVLGGMLIPLEVLPNTLEAVARALPFVAMAYAPARLASGHVEPALLALQAGWLVVLSVAAVAVFAAGERRLQVVGG